MEIPPRPNYAVPHILYDSIFISSNDPDADFLWFYYKGECLGCYGFYTITVYELEPLLLWRVLCLTDLFSSEFEEMGDVIILSTSFDIKYDKKGSFKATPTSKVLSTQEEDLCL